MTRARYIQRYDNEGFEIPLGKIYRLACCDCGLVHDVVWVVEDGKLGMAARRNKRATAQKRRVKPLSAYEACLNRLCTENE